MRRTSIALLLPCLAALAVACGSAPPPSAESAEPTAPAESGARSAAPAGDEEETCPIADPSTTPPTCPDGCYWNGTECKRHRGIIVDQKP